MKKLNQKKKMTALRPNGFLKETLLKLLGTGLLSDHGPRPSEVKSMVIKNALNAVVLRN